MVSFTRRPLQPPGKEPPVPAEREAGETSGPVWISPCRESNHDFSVVQPIAQSLFYYYYYYYYYWAEITKTWKKKRELECDGEEVMKMGMMQKWKNNAYYCYYYIILYCTVEVEAAAGAAASADTTSLHKHLGTFKCCRHAPRGPCLSFSHSWMINVQQVYCHTLAYHIPIDNRTLQQWRPQLATSTPLTLQTFIQREAKFGGSNQGGWQERDKQRSQGDDKPIRFQSENLKGKERLGKPRRRWEDKNETKLKIIRPSITLTDSALSSFTS